MQMSGINAAATRIDPAVLVVRDKADVEKRACTYAVRKIDEALDMIGTAYTHQEGIYCACLHSLLDLDGIEQLPVAARSFSRKLVSALAPDADLDRNDQVLATVASLTETESLQFIDDLLSLRLGFENEWSRC